MPDIRLVRRQSSQLWIWTGILATLGLVIWASTYIFGDPTDPAQQPRVGAAAGFGSERAPVHPIESVQFEALNPLDTRDLGRLVHLRGTLESSVVRGNFWVRVPDGRRILARIEPLPPNDMPSLRAGVAIALDGHLRSISRAEFFAWMDSLNVSIPRPPPAPRFGQLPDPAFTRLRALYIDDYYIAIQPERLTDPTTSGD